MAKREGFLVSRQVKAMSPASPNAVAPKITVEVRVHWPAHMGHEDEVLRELEAAVVEARAAVVARTRPATAWEYAEQEAERSREAIAKFRAQRGLV